jgi:hypothetical protein
MNAAPRHRSSSLGSAGRRTISGTELVAARPRADIVLWGSPLWTSYRRLVRDLRVYQDVYRLSLRHRHHGVRVEHGWGVFICAQLIEVAGMMGARVKALDLFVARGRSALTDTHRFARALDLDPDEFADLHDSGAARRAVERDLSDSSRLGLQPGLSIFVGGELHHDGLDADRILQRASDGE